MIEMNNCLHISIGCCWLDGSTGCPAVLAPDDDNVGLVDTKLLNMAEAETIWAEDIVAIACKAISRFDGFYKFRINTSDCRISKGRNISGAVTIDRYILTSYYIHPLFSNYSLFP